MPQLDPTDHTIDELDDELETIDDPATLRDIREAETDGEDRTGAIETIENRLDEVADDADDTDEESAGSGDDTGGGNRNDADGDVGLVVVRNKVRNTAADLIGRDLDGIIGVREDDEGWEATVEVVERHSVPDTQDILGRYVLALDPSGAITEYRRLGRYRRGDTAPFEES